MKFYRLILHKAYFDKGFSLLNYLKYVFAFFSIKVMSIEQVVLTATAYGIVCYFLGMIWFKKNIVNSEFEVNNQYNPFVQEMRKVYKP